MTLCCFSGQLFEVSYFSTFMICDITFSGIWSVFLCVLCLYSLLMLIEEPSKCFKNRLVHFDMQQLLKVTTFWMAESKIHFFFTIEWLLQFEKKKKIKLKEEI